MERNQKITLHLVCSYFFLVELLTEIVYNSKCY